MLAFRAFCQNSDKVCRFLVKKAVSPTSCQQEADVFQYLRKLLDFFPEVEEGRKARDYEFNPVLTGRISRVDQVT